MDIVNNIGETYFVICILGKTDCEENKIFYKRQWMECYNILDDFMGNCKIKNIRSEQTKVEISSWSKDGYPKTNFKKLAVGGNMKWTKNNNEKICEKYLNERLFQIKNAHDEGLTHYQWLKNKFPELKHTVSFEYNEIIGHLEDDKINDFIFRVYDAGESIYYNQEVDIFMSKRYFDLEKNNVERFYRNIENITKSVLTATTNMPLGINIKEDGIIKMVTLWNRRLGLFNKLELKDNPIGKWEIKK